jgi:hypothetical protein
VRALSRPLTVRKLGSDRDQRVAAAYKIARAVFGALARAGELQDKQDPDTDYGPAFFARLELIAHGLDKNFPLSDNLREYLLNLCLLKFPDAEKERARRTRGRSPNENEIRDRWIAGTINFIVDRCGLHAGRSAASRDKGTNTSACTIVAEVLREFVGKDAPEERTIQENIYPKCTKQKTAYNVPETFAKLRMLLELASHADELHDKHLRKEI